MNVDQMVSDLGRLEGDRKVVEQQWDLLESFVMPSRGMFFVDSNEQEGSVNWRHRERFDDTAVFSAQSLAATIHSTLTNQSSLWFTQRFRKDELNKNLEYAGWLQKVSAHIHEIIQSSNFHVEAAEFYHDDVGFGSACMVHEVGEKGKHRFKTAMLRECFVEENPEGGLIRFYRKRAYTGLQLRDMFPNDVLPDAVLREIEKPTSKTFTLVTCIYKNNEAKEDDGTIIDNPEERQFLRKYFIRESRTEIGKVHGYYSMPVYFLRWARTAGSRWGYSQGMIVMGAILTLQEITSMTLAANEKVLDPPILATSRGVLGDIDLAARGVTYVENMDSIKEFVSSARVDFGNLAVDQLQSVVRYAFFQDKLELKESPAMTATEVNARMEQMQRFMGGAVIRVKPDFLDPLIERIFREELRAGRLPPIPEGLNEANIDIQYVGVLARTQRLDAVDSYRSWLAMLTEMALINPDVLDVADLHFIADDSGDRLGVPAPARRSLEEAATIKSDREAGMAAMAKAKGMKDTMSAANQESQALKNLNEVNSGG